MYHEIALMISAVIISAIIFFVGIVLPLLVFYKKK